MKAYTVTKLDEEIRQILRWEDDGGQNTGCDKYWFRTDSGKPTAGSVVELLQQYRDAEVENES